MAEISLKDKDIFYLREVSVIVFPLNAEARKIEKLRINFECEKTNESNPNNSIIRIYNLNKNSRSQFEGKGIRVALIAGYINNLSTLFRGDVTKTTHKSEPPDIITELEVRDGINRYRNATIDRGYPPGVKIKDVFNDLAIEMGLPIGAFYGIPDFQFANGLTLSGNVKNHLNYLSKKSGLEWSIQDESLQLLPKKETTSEGIIVLNSKTGLIGSPSKTKEGIEFNTLLIPTLRPGRRVEIQSKFINGSFKIRKVKHTGDSHEGDFISSCEAA